MENAEDEARQKQDRFFRRKVSARISMVMAMVFVRVPFRLSSFMALMLRRFVSGRRLRFLRRLHLRFRLSLRRKIRFLGVRCSGENDGCADKPCYRRENEQAA